MVEYDDECKSYMTIIKNTPRWDAYYCKIADSSM